MNKSESINELIAALSKVQAELKSAIKDSTNPFFKSKYADLDATWEPLRALFGKNGLAVTQTTDFDEKGVFIITLLGHSSGEWISGRYPLNPVKDDPQGLGSAFTYARRYTLAAITGVSQTDDDGNVASGKTETPKQPYQPPKPLVNHAPKPNFSPTVPQPKAGPQFNKDEQIPF